jgi:Fic family protein
MRKFGTYEFVGNMKFFIPGNLPPKEPSFQMDSEIIDLYGDVMLQLGKLNEMTDRLPDVDGFIRAYVYKEALLSSSIEGINTTLLDVFTQPMVRTKPNKNTQLVMNYTKAFYKALAMIKQDNFPIIARVILGAHMELMTGGDGDRSNPGSYRKQTVKVGNLVPPPAPMVPGLMAELEKYINTKDDLPVVIKAGLAHVQFETIHPFLDGNGRIGRLLITLMLLESGVLSEPIIYPSLYFKRRHFDYYKLLDGVRTDGNFEDWIKFYLSVIRDSAKDACRRAKDIEGLEKKMEDVIWSDNKSGKARAPRFNAISLLFNCPVISIKELGAQIHVSYNTAGKIVADFIRLGFLVEEDHRKRDRLFKFKSYFEVLEKEYD